MYLKAFSELFLKYKERPSNAEVSWRSIDSKVSPWTIKARSSAQLKLLKYGNVG